MTEMPKELKNSIIVGDCRERMKQRSTVLFIERI